MKGQTKTKTKIERELIICTNVSKCVDKLQVLELIKNAQLVADGVTLMIIASVLRLNCT